MKITKEWLESEDACSDGREWFFNQEKIDVIEVSNELIKQNKLDWCNWLITKAMKRKQCIQYAIYAAEQVIDIFEKEYPDDKRPRKAIDAAKLYLEKPTKENEAASAAYASSYACASSYAASYAAYATYASSSATYATYAAYAAYIEIKILKYGISLLEGK